MSFSQTFHEKMLCWLPGHETCIFPFEMGRDEAAQAIMLGTLSMHDGALLLLNCRPINTDGIRQDVRCMEQLLVSPDGRHVASCFQPCTMGHKVGGFIVNVQQGRMMDYSFHQVQSSIERPCVFLAQWSPCSRWLAFCIAYKRQPLHPWLYLLDTIVAADGQLHCPLGLQCTLPYDSSSQALRQTAVDMPPSVMLQLGELMQLQWSPDSASLILLGAWMCQTSPGENLSCVSSSVVHFK